LTGQRPTGVGRGDTVTVMLSNTPPMVQAHYGVPMASGAVLHSLNTRTDAAPPTRRGRGSAICHSPT